ncbi:LRC14 protein, partial [Halcyon senegalensis]|nr:LRC14 protein [Halcyon senegalensis]
MESLVSLCARRLVGHRGSTQRALALLPAELYPALFRAAFLDGQALVLRDLVLDWPFPVLNFQRLLGHPDPHHKKNRGYNGRLGVQAIVSALLGAAISLGFPLPPSASRCHLRLLDMTGLQDIDAKHGPEGLSLWSGTVALARASLDVAKHQNDLSKRVSKRRKGPLGVSVAPPPFAVEIRADLFVNSTSFGVLRDALGAATTGFLHIRCRDFHAEELSTDSIVVLLELLEPTGVRRVDLRFNNLGLAGLGVVLPHLTRFPNLLSLKLPYSNVDVRRATPGTDAGLRRLAAHLADLPGLKELNLGSSRLSGNLRQLLCDLKTPLESLELAFCSLLAADFAFLCQSPHAPALRKLDLSGHDFTENLLQPLQRLLEEVSASLLHLDLLECRLTDDQLEVLLPALCRCSRLRCLGLFGNLFSTAALKVLVEKTMILPDLRLVIYPYPLDCYSRGPPRPPSGAGWIFEDAVDRERFTAANAELGRMLQSFGRADVVWTTSLSQHSALDYFTL